MTFLFETTNLKKSKNFCNKKGIDNVAWIEVLKGTSHRNGGLISDGKKTVANIDAFGNFSVMLCWLGFSSWTGKEICRK